MKKVFVVLMLALALIFAAGCVTTEDPYVGTWTTTSLDDGESVAITQVVNPDGTGYVTYLYPDGYETNYPALWTKMDDGQYFFGEYYYRYSLSEDEKILGKSVYTLIEGDGFIGGIYEHIPGDDSTYSRQILQFNEDGTGSVVNYLKEAGETQEADIVWMSPEENIIVLSDINHFPYTEDGRLSVSNSIHLTKQDDGKWIETPVSGDYYSEAVIDGDILYLMTYSRETGDVHSSYTYMILEDSVEGLSCLHLNNYLQELRDDGTVLCGCGDVFTKAES